MIALSKQLKQLSLYFGLFLLTSIYYVSANPILIFAEPMNDGWGDIASVFYINKVLKEKYPKLDIYIYLDIINFRELRTELSSIKTSFDLGYYKVDPEKLNIHDVYVENKTTIDVVPTLVITFPFGFPCNLPKSLTKIPQLDFREFRAETFLRIWSTLTDQGHGVYIYEDLPMLLARQESVLSKSTFVQNIERHLSISPNGFYFAYFGMDNLVIPEYLLCFIYFVIQMNVRETNPSTSILIATRFFTSRFFGIRIIPNEVITLDWTIFKENLPKTYLKYFNNVDSNINVNLLFKGFFDDAEMVYAISKSYRVVGCTGDDSLSKALSLDKVTFYLPKGHKKEFFQSFISFLHSSEFDSPDKDKLHLHELFDNFAYGTADQFMSMAQGFDYETNFQFFQSFLKIVKEEQNASKFIIASFENKQGIKA